MTADKLPRGAVIHASSKPTDSGRTKGAEMMVPISPRSRKWGYVFWPKFREDEAKKLFVSTDYVTIKIPIEPEKRMRIQWKYCRVYIGTSWSKRIPESHTTFQMIRTRSGTIEVSSR
jgi:hypothetical protein